jgi:predicted RNA polymerase sigma factor
VSSSVPRPSRRPPVLERVFREHRAAVLAALVRSLGDFELAEDALQEAFTIAVEQWAAHGEPDAPAAWLLTVARNRAIDGLRRRRTGEAKLQELPPPEPEATLNEQDRLLEVGDERLSLVFTCCHPALAP